MFKKFVSYLTLFCFFNSSCIEPALASSTQPELHDSGASPKFPRINLAKNAHERFVIDGKSLFEMDIGHGILAIEGGALFDENFAADLYHNSSLIGRLSVQQRNLNFQGLDNHNFHFLNLPVFNAIDMNVAGSMTIEHLLECRYFLNVVMKGRASFHQGFRVQDEKAGLALFSGGSYEIKANSNARGFELNALDELKICLGASLKSGAIVSQGVAKSLVILGELNAKLAQLELENLTNKGNTTIDDASIKTGQFTNTKDFKSDRITLVVKQMTNTDSGRIQLGQASWDAEKGENAGAIDIAKTLMAKGSWQNYEKGTLKVGEYLQGSFSTYNDDGSTEVQGLASVHAENGRLCGHTTARYAMFRFQQPLNVSDAATFTFEDHLTLHSDSDLGFAGTARQKELGLNFQQTQSLYEMLRDVPRGVFLSSQGDLNKTGVVSVKDLSINYSVKGNSNIDGYDRAGFFKDNNIAVDATHARLMGQIKSFYDMSLRGQLADLMGSRHIDGTLFVDVKNLVQHKGDTTKFGAMSGQAVNATLGGTIEMTKFMSLKVLNHFKTEISGLIRGGTTSVKTGSAELRGDAQDTSMGIDAERLITLGKTYKPNLKSSTLYAESIIHETGSAPVVEGDSVEDAKKLIKYEEGSSTKAKNNRLRSDGHVAIAGTVESEENTLLKAKTIDVEKKGQVQSGQTTHAHAESAFANYGKMAAKNHFLIGGDSVYNSGTIASTGLHSVDTRRHYNVWGGAISAERAVINADWWSINFLSTLSAKKDVEINTGFNMNLLSLTRGAESLKVNALVNLNGGLYMSKNVTVNALVDLTPRFGCIGFDPSSALRGEFAFSTLVNPGLSFLSGLASGTALIGLKGAQLAWNLIPLVQNGHKLLTSENPEDDENYWRLSRVVKRTGEYAALGLQAYQNVQEARAIGKLCMETYYPEPPVSPSDNKDSTADNKPATEAPKPLTLSEKFWEQASLENLQSMGSTFLPGTMTVNSLWSSDSGYNIMPHVIKRSAYLNDRSYNIAIDRMVKAGTGKDHSSTLARTNNVTSVGDLEYGAKVKASQNSVHAGGNLTNTKDMNDSSTSSHFKSDKKMVTEEGAQTSGDSKFFES